MHATKQVSISEVFEVAKANWTRNWGYWFLFAMIVPIGALVIDPSNWIALYQGLMEGFSEAAGDGVSAESSAILTMLSIVVWPISMLITVVSTVLTSYGGTVFMMRSARGEVISSVKECLPPSLKKAALLYGSSLALGIAFAAIVVLASAPGVIAGFIAGTDSSNAMIAWVFAGFSALLAALVLILRYWPVIILYIDKGISLQEAFTLAPKVAKGGEWMYILLGFLAILLHFVGFMALIVGLLVAAPFCAIMMGAFYQRLVDATPEAAELKSVIK